MMAGRFTAMCTMIGSSLAGVVLVASLAGSAQAEDWPSKPIQLLVGFPAGGVVDTAARLLSGALEGELKQQVVVVPTPGAGGTIASQKLTRAAPDGYTLMLQTSGTLFTRPAISNLPFSYKDFTPIATVAASTLTISVQKDSKWKTFADFVADAKANPGKYTYATAGAGGQGHIAMVIAAQAAGIDVTHVPFEGGPASVAALVGGHVDLLAGDNISPEIRALATTHPRRNTFFPDTPTMKELGYDVELVTRWMVIGPEDLPQPIVERLQAAIEKAVQKPNYVNPLNGLQIDAMYEFRGRSGQALAKRSGTPEEGDCRPRPEQQLAGGRLDSIADRVRPFSSSSIAERAERLARVPRGGERIATMMSWLGDLASGFSVLLNVPVMLAALGGVAIGVFVGAVPGLTVAVAVSLAIPITFAMEPVTALALLLGIFKGGIYGGSITAILINTPGTAAAAATVFDGYPMAQKGQAGKALLMALYASVFADAVGVIVLIAVAEPIARIAIKFGPAEIFSLMFFSLTIIAAVSGESLVKGIIAAAVGFMLSVVGQDPITGAMRFDFGMLEFQGGLALVPMLIGLFAASEIFVQWQQRSGNTEIRTVPRTGNPDDEIVTLAEFKHCLPIFLRASGIGVMIGALPGIGSTVSAFLSYADAKRRSKHPEMFGKGSIEGVAAAEAGNNAVVGASLVPLLTFGIPGDLIAAILLGALLIHGIPVGPTLFTQHREVVYSVFAVLLLSIVMLYVVGRIGIWFFRRITDIPQIYILPIVLVLCVVGTFAVNNSMFDVWVMIIFGVLGYLMRRTGVPLPPLLIAFVLAPQTENALRQSLILSHGSPEILVTRPISLFFLLAAGLAVYRIIRSRTGRQAPADRLSSKEDAIRS